jgi:signal transduction histidine kinase
LGAATELTVYRVLQEALTNTIKHSSATAAHVLLRYQRPVVELKVSDNGTGRVSLGEDGHGIAGMRERARLHGGMLEAGPVDGGGWCVAATLRPGPTVTT